MPFGYDSSDSWLRDDDEFDRYNKPGSSDWFALSDDVSWNKPNNRHDGIKVESLLGYGGYMDVEKTGGPLGLSPGRLEEPIKKFQEKNGLKVDGLLKPGGPTITKMKQLYGGAFGKTPAPTPAMVDADAWRRHEGEDGFLYDKGPKFELKPNRRLDGKAHLMEFERWNREWARGSGHVPESLAPEYEGYIRDLHEEHGHDAGLVFARDLTKQVERYHDNGSALAKRLVTLLSDRPDLQREFLGGEVPKAPPVGTFKPDGEAGVKAWIDEDRVAKGFKPKFSAAAAQNDAPVLRTSSGTQPAPATEPDPKNLLEYGQNFGLPEDWGLEQQPPHEPDQPNPRPVDPPKQSDSERMRDDKSEPPHAPTLGEVDHNQMPPVPRTPVAERAPPPPRPTPLRMPDRVDPMNLSDDEFEDAFAKASEQAARAGQEAADAQSEVERLTTALREHGETFRQQIQIGIAEGTGEASQTLPAEAPENRGPAGRAAARAVERHTGDAAFQGGAEAFAIYIRTKHRLEEQLAAAEALAKRGSEVADAYSQWSRTLANDRLRRRSTEAPQ